MAGGSKTSSSSRGLSGNEANNARPPSFSLTDPRAHGHITGVRAAAVAVLFVAVSACSRPSPPAGQGHTIPCPVRGDFKSRTAYFGQFYEDYVLSYVFDQKDGTYLDVGANHPVQNNVTNHFYNRGWHGMNIEPHPVVFAALNQARTRDVNLNVGVADVSGTLTFYDFGWNGLSTFDREIALGYQRGGAKPPREIAVPVLTLNEVLEKHPLPDITFMNLDVEGYERRVLLGVDLAKHHPIVIMVESTAPLSEIDTSAQWEPLLKNAGYVFALFDGLNRYYVHPSRKDLLPRFAEIGFCVAMDKIDKGIKLDGWSRQ
jgi:FkbM family methyltransferase